MTIEILQKEMIKAMKNGEVERKSVLSNAIAAIKKEAIDQKKKDNITEEFVNEILLKEKKTIQEMIDTCPKDREDTLKKYQTNMNIISEYAPTLLEDAGEIESLIKTIIPKDMELTRTNKGKIMKVVMPAFKGKADMSIVNQVINKILI